MKPIRLAATIIALTPNLFASENTTMWYDRPADAYGWKSPLQSWKVESPNYFDKGNPDKAWEKYALPLGNGFMGAMIYGGISYERIQLNEESIWSGGPGVEGWIATPNDEDAHKHLDEIRQLLLKGDKASRGKAQSLSSKHLRGVAPDKKAAPGTYFGRYQTFGELIIETGHSSGKKNKDKLNYKRQLDLSTGIHTVSYQHEQTHFTRESFCSNPDRVLVIHFDADKPGQQNLTLKSFSPHKITPSAKDGVFVASGELRDNGLKVEVRIGILHQAGQVKVSKDGIKITNADNVTFIVVMGTDYKQEFPTYRGAHPAAKNKKILATALGKGRAKLRTDHIADHRNLHGRVSIDLGTTPDDILKLPIDKRLALNSKTPDHDLEELYFQFGRYLMIGSSRPGSLPANLQGIWCNEMVPAWNSDYHLNINLQMNYWPSGPCNLLECQEPLITYTDSLRKPGAATAKAYHNARGWTANLHSNIWGFTAPNTGKGPVFWSYFPLAGAWLSTHAFEQYAFGLDADYLRKTSWPILSETADFLVDYLYKLPNGKLSSTPSWSPEHGPISLGATCDIATAREALKGAIAAAQALGEKGKRIDTWKKTLDQLVPYKIGQHGQLQEWYEDIDNPKDKHRHLNHLFGLHPGTQISPVHTPELAQAAKTALIQRGDGATGWSMGWKINFWARIHDGDHAYILVRNLLKKGTNPNLFDIHPPFQIDGNFGGCAGIAEMIMQSHYRKNGGEIDLLPALPSAWPKGSVKGLLARGGFTVDATWEHQKITSATITADKARLLTVRYNGKSVSRMLKAGESITLK